MTERPRARSRLPWARRRARRKMHTLSRRRRRSKCLHKKVGRFSKVTRGPHQGDPSPSNLPTFLVQSLVETCATGPDHWNRFQVRTELARGSGRAVRPGSRPLTSTPGIDSSTHEGGVAPLDQRHVVDLELALALLRDVQDDVDHHHVGAGAAGEQQRVEGHRLRPRRCSCLRRPTTRPDLRCRWSSHHWSCRSRPSSHCRRPLSRSCRNRPYPSSRHRSCLPGHSRYRPTHKRPAHQRHHQQRH